MAGGDTERRMALRPPGHCALRAALRQAMSGVPTPPVHSLLTEKNADAGGQVRRRLKLPLRRGLATKSASFIRLLRESLDGRVNGFLKNGDEFFIHERVVVADVENLDGRKGINLGEHGFNAGRIFTLHRKDEISPEDIVLPHAARTGLAQTDSPHLHPVILTEDALGGRATAFVAAADKENFEAFAHGGVVAGRDAERKAILKKNQRQFREEEINSVSRMGEGPVRGPSI